MHRWSSGCNNNQAAILAQDRPALAALAALALEFDGIVAGLLQARQ